MLESDFLKVFFAGICTLAIYSYLYKENPFFRFFEHFFIGIAAGFGLVFAVFDFLWPKILKPMLGYNVEYYPDGTVVQAYSPAYLLYLLPMAFGLLYYTIYSRRFSWLSRVVITFSLGVAGGLTFEGFFNGVIPQITSSFKALLVFTETHQIDWNSSVRNLVFVGTLLIVMNYFFFSFKSKTRFSDGLNKTGRYLLMLCFGAFFGSTVMARMALLVDRVNFLLGDWLDLVKNLFVS